MKQVAFEFVVVLLEAFLLLLAVSAGGGTSSRALEKKTLTIDEFCSNLSPIEEYLTTSFTDLFNITNFPNGNYNCSCSQQQTNSYDNNNKTVLLLDLYCDLVYLIEGDEESHINFEHAIYELDDDRSAFILKNISWGDTLYQSTRDSPQETYVFDDDDGTLVGCTGKDCGLCTICPDTDAIAIDCSTLSNSLDFITECSDNYTGAFLNTYDDDTNIKVLLLVATTDDTAAPTDSSDPVEEEPSGSHHTSAFNVVIWLLLLLPPMMCH